MLETPSSLKSYGRPMQIQFVEPLLSDNREAASWHRGLGGGWLFGDGVNKRKEELCLSYQTMD